MLDKMRCATFKESESSSEGHIQEERGKYVQKWRMFAEKQHKVKCLKEKAGCDTFRVYYSFSLGL